MNTDILETMRVRCPKCKAAPGKVCKGYARNEQPLHQERHEAAPEPFHFERTVGPGGKVGPWRKVPNGKQDGA